MTYEEERVIDKLVAAVSNLINMAKTEGLEYLKVEKLGIEFRFSGPAIRTPRPARGLPTEAVYPTPPTPEPPETE